jgi:hypothetical protein
MLELKVKDLSPACKRQLPLMDFDRFVAGYIIRSGRNRTNTGSLKFLSGVNEA